MADIPEKLAFSLEEGKRLFKVGKETGVVLSRAEMLEQLNDAEPVSRLIAELSVSAKNCSEVQKMMAEGKSLRQTDNPEDRKDLYSWNKPVETLDGRAAIMLATALGVAMDVDPLTILTSLAPELLLE